MSNLDLIEGRAPAYAGSLGEAGAGGARGGAQGGACRIVLWRWFVGTLGRWALLLALLALWRRRQC